MGYNIWDEVSRQPTTGQTARFCQWINTPYLGKYIGMSILGYNDKMEEFIAYSIEWRKYLGTQMYGQVVNEVGGDQ